MNIVLLKNYNNYFNRIIKHEKTLAEYLSKAEEYVLVNDVNFYDMDGVNAEHVFNFKGDFVPDYLLVINEYNVILSKWFVLEWQKIRGKQYRAVLRGDVIANYFNDVLNAPCFIEKSMLPINSPLLFNKEGMTFNQIKNSEILLKDKTEIGWLVGYYAQDDKNEGKDRVISGKIAHIEGSAPVEDISTIRSGVNINFGNENKITYAEQSYEMNFNCEYYFKQSFNGDKVSHVKVAYNFGYMTGFSINDVGFGELLFFNANNYNNIKPNYGNFLKEFFSSSSSEKDFIQTLSKYFLGNNTSVGSKEYIYSLNGKYISRNEQGHVKTYKLTVELVPNNITKRLYTEDKEYNEFVQIFKQNPDFKYADFTDLDPRYHRNVLDIAYTGYRFIVKATPSDVAYDFAKVNISHLRNHLNDSPYDMFCIPYDLRGIKHYKMLTDEGTFDINNQFALAMTRSIMAQLGGTGANKFVLDVQYLPYCPIKELKDSFNPSTNTFDIRNISGFEKGKDFDIIYRTNDPDSGIPVIDTPFGFMAWATESSGTFDIPYEYKVPSNVIDKKIQYETLLFRLCSPNYNGIFEFNPIKNNGVRYFNVDYTYKPFQPYIHINPDFSGLYGKDFNDNNGLIVGGDFSIPGISDNFINYELNNKNYQDIFNREIKNMDVNYENQVLKNAFTTGYHALTGGVAGAIGGFMTGGPIGAGVGALTGAGGTAISGLSNMYFERERFNEARDFKKDMYGYTLGNIKAQPQSISKTTPFTYNNKIFPFVEIYSCTEEEKSALRNKIKYNGMTTMVIGTISDYLTNELNYFQGEIIRLEGLEDDFHIANEIYQEIAKGVYICK